MGQFRDKWGSNSEDIADQKTKCYINPFQANEIGKDNTFNTKKDLLFNFGEIYIYDGMSKSFRTNIYFSISSCPGFQNKQWISFYKWW